MGRYQQMFGSERETTSMNRVALKAGNSNQVF